MSTPKVSVILLAYNHAQFIGQALDGILSQQVDFAYEIIVGEDCSTDQTRAVVQDYERRYPGRLRPIYHPRNVGVGANVRACWAACAGQYIAVLDGDDYWTSPLKLARQVACLDAEPEVSFCFHQVEVMHAQNATLALFTPATDRTRFFFADFLLNCPAHTGSLMFRNGCRVLPDWLFATYPIDFPLLVLYAEVGAAQMLPEVMSRYRIHAVSTWSAASYRRNHARFLAMYRLLVAHYASTPHARALRRAFRRKYLHAASSFFHTGLPQAVAQLLRRAELLLPARSRLYIRRMVGVAGR